jgi:hypothetical protein
MNKARFIDLQWFTSTFWRMATVLSDVTHQLIKATQNRTLTKARSTIMESDIFTRLMCLVGESVRHAVASRVLPLVSRNHNPTMHRQYVQLPKYRTPASYVPF